MQWYYVDQNQERQPFDESALGDFVKDGTIGSDSLLWNETMTDWLPANELFPAWFPASHSPPQRQALEQPPLPEPEPEPLPVSFPPARPDDPEIPSLDAVPAVKPSKRPAKIIRTKGRPVAADQSEMIKDFASYLNANRGWMKFFGVLSIIQGSILCLSIVYAVVGWLPIWLGVTVFKAAKAAELAEHSGSRGDLEESLYRLGFFFKLSGIVVIAVLAFAVVIGLVVAFTGVMAVISSKLAPDRKSQLCNDFRKLANSAAPAV